MGTEKIICPKSYLISVALYSSIFAFLVHTCLPLDIADIIPETGLKKTTVSNEDQVLVLVFMVSSITLSSIAFDHWKRIERLSFEGLS